MGIGECAGEVVSLVEFDLADAEREVFEAQLLLEAGDNQHAAQRAYQAMLQAAKALVRTQLLDVGDDPDRIVEEFKTRFVDNGAVRQGVRQRQVRPVPAAPPRRGRPRGRPPSRRTSSSRRRRCSSRPAMPAICAWRPDEGAGRGAASQVVTLESLA